MSGAKAFVYEIQITEGYLALAHGWTYPIKELYLPEENLVANLGGNGGQMMVFTNDGSRMKEHGTNVEETTISKAFAIQLVNTLRNKELENELREVLGKVKPKKGIPGPKTRPISKKEREQDIAAYRRFRKTR